MLQLKRASDGAAVAVDDDVDVDGSRCDDR
jgi:hypothetical protein